MSPEKPRVAGELHLRVTSSDSASFKSASDLLRTVGQVWMRPLFALSKYYPPLYRKLREDRLILDDLATALSSLPSKRYIYSPSHYLYTLDNTFFLDF